MKDLVLTGTSYLKEEQTNSAQRKWGGILQRRRDQMIVKIERQSFKIFLYFS